MQKQTDKGENKKKIHCLKREASEMRPGATNSLLNYSCERVSRSYVLLTKMGTTSSFPLFAVPNSSSRSVVATVSIICRLRRT